MNIEITYMPLKLFVDETDEVFEARMNEVYTSMGYWCSKRAFELGDESTIQWFAGKGKLYCKN